MWLMFHQKKIMLTLLKLKKKKKEKKMDFSLSQQAYITTEKIYL